MQTTNIFHIVFFDYDLSAYVHFFNCNFRCLGCLRKLFIWDCHLPNDVISKLRFKEFLSLNDLKSIMLKMISTHNMKRAVLGGGEPTTDPSLTEILRELKDLSMDIVVLTNAYAINDGLLREMADSHATVIASIKSINPAKHKMYTGFPLKPVLNNVTRIYNSNIKMLIETIAIPGFNNADEIGQLAKFIASIDRKIPLIIDSFIPVPGAPWRRTTLEELEEAEREALKYLDNVYGRGKVITEGLKGGVHLIYPETVS